MYRVKLYMASRLNKKGRQYPEFQGSTIELSEEQIRNKEKTTQLLIDDFVRNMKGIMLTVRYKGVDGNWHYGAPQGLKNSNWREKVLDKMSFEFPEVVPTKRERKIERKQAEVEREEILKKPRFFLTEEIVNRAKERTLQIKEKKRLYRDENVVIEILYIVPKKPNKKGIIPKPRASIITRDIRTGRFIKMLQEYIRNKKA
jgi:hypothetical protein